MEMLEPFEHRPSYAPHFRPSWCLGCYQGGGDCGCELGQEGCYLVGFLQELQVR